MSESIMITLPCNIVSISLGLGNVWTDNLPVIASIFKLYLTVQHLDEMLSNLRGSSEQCLSGITLLQDLLIDWTTAINEIKIFLGESTVMEHPNPLFERERGSLIWLDTWLVSHEEGTAHLQNWNFNWEVEWCDDTNTTEWESIASAELTTVIAGVPESFRQKSNIITAEILNESSSNSHFSNRLISALWAASLNTVNEEVENFWVVKDLRAFRHNSSKHNIPLFVLVWIMKSTLGSILNAIDEWQNLIKTCIRN